MENRFHCMLFIRPALEFQIHGILKIKTVRKVHGNVKCKKAGMQILKSEIKFQGRMCS